MHIFSTKLIRCLADRVNMEESIQELLRSKLETAVNELLKLELTRFLNYENKNRIGFNSRNGRYLKNTRSSTKATYVPLRRDTVQKEAIHIVLGITMDGTKEMLGYADAPCKSAVAWETLLGDIRSRGEKRPLLFVVDGLKGIEEAILRFYPKAGIQRCLVHVMRNIASHVRVKDRMEILGDFKQIHRRDSAAAAVSVLDGFVKKWNPIHPKMIASILENRYLLTFYESPRRTDPRSIPRT
ncbi:MAG: transposase [Candidatus Izemoplasmatales bacterium]